MKFNELPSFIHSAIHISSKSSVFYFILSEDVFEREYYASHLKKKLKSEMHPSIIKQADDVSSETFSQMDIFQETKWFEIRGINQNNSSRVLEALKKGGNHFSVIFTGEALPESFNKNLKGKILSLDLVNEKPWKRKDRYKREIISRAKDLHKHIEIEIADLILERLGHTSLGAAWNEITKLCTYLGEKNRLVSQRDVEAIITLSREYNLWQVSEDIVWFNNVNWNFEGNVCDLIKCVRYNLNMGVKIILGNAPIKLSRKKMHTFKKKCETYGINYFFKGISLIFECEVLLKTSNMSEIAIWENFIIKFLVK